MGWVGDDEAISKNRIVGRTIRAVSMLTGRCRVS